MVWEGRACGSGNVACNGGGVDIRDRRTFSVKLIPMMRIAGLRFEGLGQRKLEAGRRMCCDCGESQGSANALQNARNQAPQSWRRCGDCDHRWTGRERERGTLQRRDDATGTDGDDTDSYSGTGKAQCLDS